MWEQRDSSSPDIRIVWRAFVDEPDTYTAPASEFWGISFARQPDGLLRAELDGPSLTSRTVASVRGEWYWGVELGAHVAIAGVDKSQILGLTVNLPVEDNRVAVGGHWHQVPEWRQVENFVARLIDVGSLVVDPYVRAALRGDEDGYSRRSWQRRFRGVTGITRKQIDQLKRARHAFVLIRRGIPVSEAAHVAGYADQSHLTRALKLIEGETPGRIAAR
jgi:AraC-like DNA-binding protein